MILNSLWIKFKNTFDHKWTEWNVMDDKCFSLTTLNFKTSFLLSSHKQQQLSSLVNDSEYLLLVTRLSVYGETTHVLLKL